MSSLQRRILQVTLPLLLLASASWSDVIVFKDCETLVTEGRYRVEGDKVFVTLQSGAETSFPVAEIDLKKTDDMNRATRGSAVVLDTIKDENARPRPADRSLRDLVRDRPAPRAVSAPAADDAPSTQRRTPAGNVDLFGMARQPLQQGERAERIKGVLGQKGLAAADLYQGSTGSRLLIDVVTAARGDVFAALERCAAALLEVRAQFPEIEAFEIAMATSSRSRAGQFVLTPDEAQSLVDDTVTPAEHFVAKVLF